MTAPIPEAVSPGFLRGRSVFRHATTQQSGGPIDRARRMRRLATGLLLAMAGLYLTTRLLEPRFPQFGPALGFVRAFAEAAMVGGLADWFAVTALFRHPLGVPIPHTAIIPENKDRIATTMAAFLQDNFLIPIVVARRLQAMNAAVALGGFLAGPQGEQSRIRAGAAGLIADVLESLDPEQLGGLAKNALRTQIEKWEVAPLLGQLLNAAIADKRHMPLIDAAIRRAALVLEDNEQLIRSIIHERANTLLRWTGLDERLASAVLDGLYKLLAETVVDPQHPLRRRIEEGLEELAEALLHDPAMRERVERLKREVLANPAFARWLDALWERGRARLLQMVRQPNGMLAGQLGTSVADLGAALQRDPQLQIMVNRFARRTLVGVAVRYGGQIVRLVSETVKRWDARTVTDRIESAVGRDLQFIRINGTMVGGLVGLLIHAMDVLM